MKLILTKDVTSLGSAGDAISVKDGYARNYLLPNNLAVKATTRALKDIAASQAKLEEEKAAKQAEFNNLAKRIDNQLITLKAKVSKDKDIFGSINEAQIVSALKDQKGIELDKKHIKIAEPIKKLGDYKINIELSPEIKSEINLKVTEQGK